MSNLLNEKALIGGHERNNRNGEESIRFYTEDTDNARAINSVERNRIRGEGSGFQREEINNNILRHCNGIEVFMRERYLSENLRLYRGTSLKFFCASAFEEEKERRRFLQNCSNLDDETLNGIYRNQIITYRQYASTSKKFEIACDFLIYQDNCLLEIYAPIGTNGADISEYSEYPECEILLGSHLQMRIDKITKNGYGGKIIQLYVVGERGNKDTKN